MSKNEHKQKIDRTEREDAQPQAEEQAVNAEKTADDVLQDADGAQTSEPAAKQISELEAALAAAEDYKRKWYAVSAEYDNYRKRNQTAVAQAFADGKAEAVLKLVPVADTFGYAYDGATDEKTKTGIDKIVKNFNTILASLGVEEIPLNVGDAFDEGVAEAVMNVPCGEGEQPNAVKQILKKGYKQGDKVIRFAQVIVTIEA